MAAPLPPAPRRKKKEPPKPAVYRSSEGIPILVGKNNKQNDYLTHRLASPTDTWLHTKEIPGSHTVKVRLPTASVKPPSGKRPMLAAY